MPDRLSVLSDNVSENIIHVLSGTTNMAELNKIKGMVVGEYGVAKQLTIVDDNGVAIDISSYTTSKVVTLKAPFNMKTVTLTATFVTTGTDGKITFTPAAGEVSIPGIWEGQVKLESASAVLISQTFDVEVDKKISADS